MGPGKVPPDDQLPEWAVKMKEKSGTIRNAEFPDREAFDYEKVWSSPYMGDSKQPWKAADYPHWRTRDYTTKVFDGIKANFPELWKEGRLHHLPGGELFSLLNKKMIAGEFPGMSTIKDYYTDVQHVRAGCPGYTVAALFYAGLFAFATRKEIGARLDLHPMTRAICLLLHGDDSGRDDLVYSARELADGIAAEIRAIVNLE
jgi:hypothetical protein